MNKMLTKKEVDTYKNMWVFDKRSKTLSYITKIVYDGVYVLAYCNSLEKHCRKSQNYVLEIDTYFDLGTKDENGLYETDKDIEIVSPEFAKEFFNREIGKTVEKYFKF